MKLLLFAFQIVILFFILRSQKVSCFSKCNPDESSALLKLKAELPTDPTPRCFSNWSESTNCCNWEGVTCDNVTGHVIGLDLHCGLRGFITSNSSLFKLTHLQSLDLKGIDFQGSSIVPEFGGFKNMTHLDLSFFNFSGDVPLEFSHLSKLVYLRITGEIRFSAASFKALSQNLTSLSYLYLDGVDLASAHFANFSSLTSLYLMACEFHGEILENILGLSSSNFSGDVPLEISHLSKLATLVISGGIKFSEATFKALSQNLPSLRKLALESVDLSSAHFTNFSSLTSLYLMACEFHGEILENILGLSSSNFSGDVPLEISHLSKLATLVISGGIKFSEATFKALSQNLPSLSELALESVDLSSAHFTNFSSLTSLYLSDCKFHAEILDNILVASFMPKLQVLDLSDNWELTSAHFPYSNNWTSPRQQLSIDLPRLLRNGRSLTDLSISNCQFTNSFSQHIPETHIPSNLTWLYLPSNFLNGTIPSWIYKLPYLSDLDLMENEFTGKISEFKSTSLVSLSLGGNKLNGSVPRSIFQNVGLQFLDLSSNSLTGSLDLKELSNLKELQSLDLSFNNLSVHFNNSINYTLPNLDTLALSSCNISEFPNFLSSSKSLSSLDLSSNKIKGSVPKWLWDLGKDSLNDLNLSHNSLTFMEPLPWKNLRTLDLRSNSFSGPIPISSAPSLYVLLGSKNQFWGEISTSFCNMTSLQILDLSDNNLSGKIPPCFSNFSSSLSVLDLRRNKLHGSIPGAFSKENSMRNLNLNGNQLEGALPRSLMNCSYLEVLDVGNNFLNGTFPDWIESLPQLRVLVLRSNMFHGSLENPKTQFPFKGLRIIDLSNNKFSGPLPTKLFENFEAMTNAENVKMDYMGNYYYYRDSIMVTLKGNYIELVKILTIFTTIDFSCNNFTGEIPSLVGRLQSLKGLNFSHNMLSGTIPSTLGNLTNLESLDLSSNSLIGKIPGQLASSLYQLQILNLSSNKLEGPIPRGSQFDTFTEDSYRGNMQLCGLPLLKSCQYDPATSKEEGGDEEEGYIGLYFNWKVVMMGYGSGLVIGISIGYMSLFSGRFDYWLAKRSVKAQQKKINIARSRAARRRRSN